jgi:zinc transport system substrate-binding protein
MWLMVLAAVAGVGAAPGAAQEGHRLRIGVAISPYYSWVANIVGKAPVEVVSVVGSAAEVHNYQPTPEDLKRLADLDVLVVNGLGHDDFLKGMIEASGNRKVKLINPNVGIPLIPYQRGKFHSHGDEKEPPKKGPAYNPHTFLSLTSAVQQIYGIERELSLLVPEHAETFRANARAYAKKLRELKADASSRLAGALVTQVATVHDGYSYFLQEFGIEIVGVIEPAHGVEPSAKELAQTIEAIKDSRVRVIFSELTFSEKLVEVIRKETGVRVYTFDHMSKGEFTPDRFEKAMKANVDTLVRALVTDAKTP